MYIPEVAVFRLAVLGQVPGVSEEETVLVGVAEPRT